MNLKKRYAFHPKRVKITQKEEKHYAENHSHGARFGHRFFPYGKKHHRG